MTMHLELEEIRKSMKHGIIDLYELELNQQVIYVNLFDVLSQVQMYFHQHLSVEVQSYSELAELEEYFMDETAADFVFREMETILKDFLKEFLEKRFKKQEYLTGEGVLELYLTVLNDFKRKTKLLNDAWTYEDCLYTFPAAHVAFSSLKDVLFVKNKWITDAALKVISEGRNGGKINSNLIHNVIQTYIDLGQYTEEFKNASSLPYFPKGNFAFYEEHFEKPVLKVLENLYLQESLDCLTEHSFAEYIPMVKRFFRDETSRATSFLHERSVPFLMQTLESIFIRPYFLLIKKEFEDAVEKENKWGQYAIYQVLIPRRGAQSYIDALIGKHIRREGLAAIRELAMDTGFNKSKNPTLYVNTIVEVYKKCSAWVSDTFRNEAHAVEAMDKACREFFNYNAVTKAPRAPTSHQLFAKFFNLLEKQIMENPDDKSLEATFDEVLMVASNYLKNMPWSAVIRPGKRNSSLKLQKP